MLRPQFETMESLTLLSVSTLHPLAAAIAQIHARPDRAAPTSTKVTLTDGFIMGNYVRRTTAKTVTFAITRGTVNLVPSSSGMQPLQNATVRGSIVYNYKGRLATSLKSASITMAVDRRNSITLTLALPKRSNPNTQFTFNYRITRATGEFRGNNETGQVTFVPLTNTFSAVFT